MLEEIEFHLAVFMSFQSHFRVPPQGVMLRVADAALSV
jgi:hypothetical protein